MTPPLGEDSKSLGIFEKTVKSEEWRLYSIEAPQEISFPIPLLEWKGEKHNCGKENPYLLFSPFSGKEKPYLIENRG